MADARDFPNLQTVQLKPNDTLKKDARFLCPVRFFNDLPEVPCDPKMLIPPLNIPQLAAFSLTSLERETKHDLLFSSDLGIPINPLDIERYTIPQRPPALDPLDAALLGDAATADAANHGGRPRPKSGAKPAEASWLLRTTYITNELVEPGKKMAVSGGVKPKIEEPTPLMSKENMIEVIEKTFQDAAKPPVHSKNPQLVATEILPVLPDELLDNWSCVLANFDGNPIDGVERVAKLEGHIKQRVTQGAQLKSLAMRKANGNMDRFVAFMLPLDVENAANTEEDNGAVNIPAEQLQGDYEWIREYDSAVRYDEKHETYLFRLAGDHVAFRDLNTKVTLKKRKRQASEAVDEPFLQPEKFVLRLPGTVEEGVKEQAPQEEEDQGTAMPVATATENGTQQQQQEEGGDQQNGDAEMVDVAPVPIADVMRDVFGSDDDD